MRKINDISGNKYGKLTVKSFNRYERDNLGRNRSYWNCVCECGNECVRRRDNLLYKKSNSCCDDCLKQIRVEYGHKTCDALSELGKEFRYKTKHGDTGTKFYNTWLSIKARCEDVNSISYPNYGGRGIKVEWSNYEDFKDDMHTDFIKHIRTHGEGNTSIDRIDVNKNYSKHNCKWATNKEQSNNRRNTIYVEMNDGELIPLSFIAESLKINKKTLEHRYYRSEFSGTYKIPYEKIIKDEDIV